MRIKNYLWGALLSVSLVTPAQADRLRTASLEENNFTETIWSSVTASPAIVTTPVHSGTYALEVNNTSVAEFATLETVSQTSGTQSQSIYVRIGTFPASKRFIMRFNNNGPSATAHIFLINTGSWVFGIRNNLVGAETNGTFALSTGTWYRLEFRYLLSDTVGELELNVYTGESTTADDTISRTTGEDTLNFDLTFYDYGNMEADSALVIQFDDIAINDDQGAFQNGAPGPHKGFLLEPSGDNTVTWTKDGSAAEATNWEGVDDLPGAPDDGTTYNSKTTNGTDKLDMTNLGAEVPSDADIILVDVYGRQGSNGTSGTRVIDFDLWDQADSQTTLLDVNADLNGWTICASNGHLVFDAGSRTKANIDSFRVGYSRSIGGSNEIRITTQWAIVEWTEAVAAPAVRPRVVIY